MRETLHVNELSNPRSVCLFSTNEDTRKKFSAACDNHDGLTRIDRLCDHQRICYEAGNHVYASSFRIFTTGLWRTLGLLKAS